MGWRDDYNKEVPEVWWQNLGFLCAVAGLMALGPVWGVMKLFASPGCVMPSNITGIIQACCRQSLFSSCSYMY